MDYTNTELNLHFGRIKDDGKIFEIDKETRQQFYIWDNVKYITESLKPSNRPKKSYINKNWGMKIKTNNRLDPKDGIGVRFGTVVTLKKSTASIVSMNLSETVI